MCEVFAHGRTEADKKEDAEKAEKKKKSDA